MGSAGDSRGGRVFKARSLLHHLTLGLRVIRKKKKKVGGCVGTDGVRIATGFAAECKVHRALSNFGFQNLCLSVLSPPS